MNAAKIRSTERLAREVYQKCRDCDGEYKNFANDVRTLDNEIQDVQDALLSNPTTTALDFEIADLITACEAVLGELSDLVDKFNNLPLQSQRTWDRLNWGGDDDDSGFRVRLTALSEQLNAIYKSLRESPTAQIDRALLLLAKEVSNGRHETSTATSLSTTVVSVDDDTGWQQIIRDLGDLGVAEKLVTENREYITDWILRAINDGILTDEKIPVEPNMVPSPLNPSPMDRSPRAPSSTAEPSQQEFQPPHSPPPRPPKTPINVNTSIPLYQDSPPGYAREALAVPPQRHLAVSPPELRPVVSRDALQLSTSHYSGVNMDEPPSPIEPDPAESNILWNAQRICYHWNRREWREARENLEAQILCVQRGEIVDVSGFPQQPDERILKHLVGVCYSLQGDFIKAREAFEAVLSDVHLNRLDLDDGDIAAARWLGETCIMTNQVLNANMAWALAYHGQVKRHPPSMENKEHQYILDDLRWLSQRTGGLANLKNAFTTSNRDASTILSNMAGTIKFDVVNATLNAMKIYPQVHNEQRRLNQNINIAEGFLIQPLVAQKSWPFPQDPFFRTKPAIDLLFALSRPRTPFATASIPTTSLGASKSLVYVSKHPIDWLVEAIRYALNTYAIEWKIKFGEYLLRLSQTNGRIAYYDIFVVKFRKLPFRNVYGFKIADSNLETRAFAQGTSELTRKAKVREELAERFKEYVKQAETDLARGEWPPQDIPDPNAQGPFEADNSNIGPNEMLGTGNRWEMPGGQGIVRRKPVHEPMSYEMIAELPG